MRPTIACKALLAVAVFLSVSSSAEQASAADRFGITEIINGTQKNVVYLIRWGKKGNWNRKVLRPGRSLIHYWQYAKANKPNSPTLYIKFDDDLFSSNNPLRSGTCNRHKGPEPHSKYAKKYRFTADGTSGRFIDLRGIK